MNHSPYCIPPDEVGATGSCVCDGKWKTHSDAHEAAHQSLAAMDSVTYPSMVAAKHIRKVLSDLVREYEQLHKLYAATCTVYAREHEERGR